MKLSLPIPKVKAQNVGSTLLPKIANVLIVLIFLFSPTQLGLHFWPSSAYLYGVRIDYLSPTLYFLDLLLLSYLFINKARIAKSLYLITPLLLINLLYSLNPLSTLSWSLHLLLYLAFVLSTPLNSSKLISLCLLPTMFFQVALGAAQVLLGKALQGPLYWLGERLLNVSSPNVAKSEIFGSMTLRSYGTFSHPNVLAGWLIVACLIVWYTNRKMSSRLIAGAITTIGIFLTFSRAAALSFFGLAIPIFWLRSFRSKIIYYFFLAISVSFFLLFKPLSLSDLSFTERFSLQKVSLNTVINFPVFGTGASASLNSYPMLSSTFRLLQPDHDSLTLLISWFGLVGILLFLYLFRNKLWQIKKALPLLPLFLLDHYFFTSPQGLFLLVLYFYLVKDLELSHAQTNSK